MIFLLGSLPTTRNEKVELSHLHASYPFSTVRVPGSRDHLGSRNNANFRSEHKALGF